jgi:phosphatidylglycerol:prolipoprotein diacylglycerol transferase
MFFYEAIPEGEAVQRAVYTLGFDGKTILGALTGGYILGEIGKKVVGVRFSTGDALAIALPVGQAIGRLGCFCAGCCYGAPSSAPWAVHQHGALRHPVALYEAAACLALAGLLAAIRRCRRPPGHLFRYYLIGYAAIRFTTEVFRGEPQVRIGPMSSAQLYCLLAGLGFLVSLRFNRRQTEPN